MQGGLERAIDSGRAVAAAKTLIAACSIALSAPAVIAATNPSSSKILTCKDAQGNPLITDPSDPRCHKPPPNEAERVAAEERKRK